MTHTRKTRMRKAIDHRRLVIERMYEMREERGHRGMWRNLHFTLDGQSFFGSLMYETAEVATAMQKIRMEDARQAAERHPAKDCRLVTEGGVFQCHLSEYSHSIPMPVGKRAKKGA